jgi:GNAT superfamily N-acetyltransferase
MHTCSIHKTLEIAPAAMSDYEQLARYHYRDDRPAVVQAVFALKRRTASSGIAGVIVYAMPTPRVELRAAATGGAFAGLDRPTELALLNRNVRCIARVIIEPRYRGIGLAARLVRETMPRMNVPIIECLGVMPRVNPFLAHAGMAAHEPPPAARHVALSEALNAVGVDAHHLVDPPAVQAQLDRLRGPAADFIEARLLEFLRSHGRRRTMPPGLERTRYVLTKLTHRPAYYIWFHPELEVSVP